MRRSPKLLSIALSATFAIVLSILVSACGGGGGEQKLEVLPPGATEGFRPLITSVSPKVANPLDEITITGRYFGETVGDSTVTLNSLKLTITSWSDTEIRAILPQGATSGIIIVTVKGRSSQSSSNAQIFIGEAPSAGAPLITGLSQSSGYPGIIITVYGDNFGESRPSDGKVFFTAESGEIEATVVPFAGAENQYKWFNTSIQVQVPFGARTGPVVVVANGQRSNSNFVFQVEQSPPPPPDVPPVIDSFSPQQGPVGTIIRIDGNYFGHSRGAGIVQLSGANLEIVLWSNTQIFAKVTPECRTGRIRLIARSFTVETLGVFEVIHIPEISGVTPSIMLSGSSLTIYGRNFGNEPGSIAFTPLSDDPAQKQTIVPATGIKSWNDTQIFVEQLPGFNSDPGVPLELEVRNVLGQSSNKVAVTLESNIVGTFEVYAQVPGTDPPEWIPQTAGVVGDTVFRFRVSAGGGFPRYDFEIFALREGSPTPITIAKISGQEVTAEKSDYTFGQTGRFSLRARITDSRRDRNTIKGPDIVIVDVDEPIITRMFMSSAPQTLPPSFGGRFVKENLIVGKNFGLLASGAALNFDDVFIPALNELIAQGIPVQGFAARNPELFINNRPYAYRVFGGTDLQVQGFNFDKLQSVNLYLNAEKDSPTLATALMFGLSEDKFSVGFRGSLPAFLEGIVKLVGQVSGEDREVIAPVPLVVAPLVDEQQPGSTYDGFADSVRLVVSDGYASPDAGNFIGNKTYVFFAFPARIWDFNSQRPGPIYDLNGDGQQDIYLAPGSVADLDTSSLSRDATSSLSIDLTAVNGTSANSRVLWPARNPASLTDPTAPALIWVASDQSNDIQGLYWYVFIWTGAKPSVSMEAFANSGIVSDAIRLKVTLPGA